MQNDAHPWAKFFKNVFVRKNIYESENYLMIKNGIVKRSINLTVKSYTCLTVLLLYFLILYIGFDNCSFVTLARAQLAYYLYEVNTVGVWNNSMLELILLSILQIFTYIIVSYVVLLTRNELTYQSLKFRGKLLKKSIVIATIYILFNIINFFIIEAVSILEIYFFDIFISVILSYILFMISILVSFLINDGSDKTKSILDNCIKFLKSNLIGITCVLGVISLVYGFVSYIVTKYVYIQSISINTNIKAFSFIDLITNPTVPIWYNILFILLSALIYSFIAYFTYVIYKYTESEKC